MAEHQLQLHFDALNDNIQAIHHGLTKLLSSCAANNLLLRKILDLLPDSTNPNQPHDEPKVFDEMLDRVNIVTTEIEPIPASSYVTTKVFDESSDDVSGIASFEISSLILADKDDLEGKAVVDKVFDEMLKTTFDETWMFRDNDETELIDNEDKAIESQKTLLNELRGGNLISVKNPFSINGHYRNQIGSKSFEMIGEHGVDSTERYNGVRSPNNLLESMNMYYGDSVGEYIARVTLKYFDLGGRFGGSSVAFYDKNVDKLYSRRPTAANVYVALCGIERWGIMDCFLQFQKHRLGNLRFSLVFLLTEELELLKWFYWFAWTTLVIDIEQENPLKEASNEFQ